MAKGGGSMMSGVDALKILGVTIAGGLVVVAVVGIFAGLDALHNWLRRRIRFRQLFGFWPWQGDLSDVRQVLEKRAGWFNGVIASMEGTLEEYRQTAVTDGEIAALRSPAGDQLRAWLSDARRRMDEAREAERLADSLGRWSR